MTTAMMSGANADASRRAVDPLTPRTKFYRLFQIRRYLEHNVPRCQSQDLSVARRLALWKVRWTCL